MKKEYTVNLFRLNNLSELNFSYKLIPTNLSSETKIELNNKMIQKAAQIVASQNSIPVAPYINAGKYYLIIPADKEIKNTKIQTTPLSVIINCTEARIFSGSKLEDFDPEIVFRFLDFEISRHLTSTHDLWKGASNQFLLKNPLNGFEGMSIDVYTGFIYKLIRYTDGNYYIVLDNTYKYIDKYNLSYHLKRKLPLKTFDGAHCLYQNGNNWYTITVEGFGNKIKDDEFTSNGTTYKVYDYIIQKNRNAVFKIQEFLRPDDTTLLYKYPGRSMEPHKGSTSLAKKIFSTNEPLVKSIHETSIQNPDKRFEEITDRISNYFQDIKFSGVPIHIDTHPKTVESKHFFIPGLKYKGENQFLKVNNFTEISEFPKNRKSMLLKNGVLGDGMFYSQFLLVPEYLDKDQVKAFKNDIEREIKKLSSSFTQFEIIRYPVSSGIPISDQINKLEEILKTKNALSGYGLVLLPDDLFESSRQIKRFHDILKNRFYDTLKFQCASVSKILSFYKPYSATNDKQLIEYKVPENMLRNFKSIIFNLALEHLNNNRKWPYALAENLNYDIYIGIDVHERFAGFSFFYKNGEQIFFEPKRVPLKPRSVRSEKIKASDIVEVVYNKLKIHIPKYCVQPNGIVFIRDGKSYEEVNALKKIIDLLNSDGLIDRDTIKWGVVDLHKKSAIPLRMVVESNNYDRYQNVITGSYKYISSDEAFLFNTGYPFEMKKATVKPIHLVLRNGNIIFEKVLKDLFHQTMLAFSAPDRNNSLPIIIKLIDTFLEPLVLYEDEEMMSEPEVYEDIYIENN